LANGKLPETVKYFLDLQRRLIKGLSVCLYEKAMFMPKEDIIIVSVWEINLPIYFNIAKG
jgi:hypothetical protein